MVFFSVCVCVWEVPIQCSKCPSNKFMRFQLMFFVTGLLATGPTTRAVRRPDYNDAFALVIFNLRDKNRTSMIIMIYQITFGWWLVHTSQACRIENSFSMW